MRNYPVRLSEEPRRWLETMVRLSSTPAKHYLVARVLLMSDQHQGKPRHTDGQIAEMLEISRRTVIRIKQRFVQESLEVALAGSFPRERPERRCLDGKGEAQESADRADPPRSAGGWNAGAGGGEPVARAPGGSGPGANPGTDTCGSRSFRGKTGCRGGIP